MMKKYVFAVVFAVALVFAFNFAVVGVSTANDTGPAEMVLKTAEAKKPATFPHAKHQKREGMTCGECHHTKGADGKQAAYVEGQAIQKCTTCHNADMANEKFNSFKKAAHGKCKACHKAKKAEGASTKCATCHPKDLK
jgi:hypothetical protein